MSSLAELVLTVGLRVVEHHRLTDGGDNPFESKPKAQNADESLQMVERAMRDLQAYVVKKEIRFPAHRDGQSLRIEIVGPICVTGYLETMTESYTTLKRIAKIVSSLSPTDAAVSSELSARLIVTRLLVIGVLTFNDCEQLALSTAVRQILSEGRPEAFGISRHAVEVMAADYRQGRKREAKGKTPALSPEIFRLMSDFGRVIAENHSGGGSVPGSERLKAVIEAFNLLQDHDGNHGRTLFRLHPVLQQDGKFIRFDTAAVLALLLWLRSQGAGRIPFARVVETLAATQNEATKPAKRYKEAVTEILLSQLADYNGRGELSIGTPGKGLCTAKVSSRKEVAVHDPH